MRVVSLAAGRTVTLAGSIFELLAGQHADFQHWLLRDSGIGTGADAIERHFADVTARLVAGRVEEAADALALLHYSFNDTLDKLNPRQLAFGCLVVAVDGQPWTDRSEEGLRRLVALLSEAGLTEELVAGEVAAVKKQLRRKE